jgi:MOSC domain-containing protein YiiM
MVIAHLERPDSVSCRPDLAAITTDSTGGARQVALIPAENLEAIASCLGVERVEPAALRRNIVTRGINLRAMKRRRFRVGEAVLETSGECRPCSKMEENLGAGGYNAVRGLGGITARVIRSGRIRVDDTVCAVGPYEQDGQVCEEGRFHLRCR